MSDDISKSKTADWEPGTLDKTRKNIGDLSAVEAKEMAEKLGGEVFYEKSSSSSSTQNSQGKNTGRIVRNQSSGGSSMSTNTTAGNGIAAPGKRRIKEELPALPKKAVNLINKTMMSYEYQIKPNYGIFNFVLNFTKNGTEKIIPAFYEHNLKNHIANMENFITVIKTMIQISPATYKAKIVNGTEVKFKFLRMVAGWTMQPIKYEYNALADINEPLLVQDLIPFIRAIYKPLITVYYYGDTKIPKLIKEIYNDECAYPDAPKDKLSDMAKQAITQWLYINNEIIRKCYPLLLRMCGDGFYTPDDFFHSQIAEILKFEELHKFDLLLPEKEKKEEKKEEKKSVPVQQKGAKDGTVLTGLKLLERLFPEAGFSNLDSSPDMFPYFQPLYKFSEGFNMLSPKNPLQITMVLHRIIEDCFQGLRNIRFIVPDNTKQGAETIYDILNDWSAYREDTFGKLYFDPLKDLVNSTYSQPDFPTSQFGKKIYTSLLWQTTYHFLPSFKFDQLLLERPTDESKYKPLFMRTDFARKYLTLVVNECDKNASSKGSVSLIANPWDHYKFDITNEVSKRLDVLLGAQNKTANTNATNANLLKYTLCFVAVLDWWLNNPDSPAYSRDPMDIYRVSREDGKPQFSVQERNDQNKLFADAIKAAYMKRAN
ncbi:MAG: hypothetical protein HUK25_09160 [Treponema sp.]|nr:hypothetical protein [Treponema sp.]